MNKINYDEFIRKQKKCTKRYTVVFTVQGYKYIILTDTVKICAGEPYMLSEFYLKLNSSDILLHPVRPDRDSFNLPDDFVFYIWGTLSDNRTDFPITRSMLFREDYRELLGGGIVEKKRFVNKELLEGKWL